MNDELDQLERALPKETVDGMHLSGFWDTSSPEITLPAGALDGVTGSLASAIDYLSAGDLEEAQMSLHYVLTQVNAWSASRNELSPDY